MPDDVRFAVGTFANADGDVFPGLVVGDDVLDLRARFGAHTTTLALLDDWERSV